jgi:hypothetical protein
MQIRILIQLTYFKIIIAHQSSLAIGLHAKSKLVDEITGIGLALCKYVLPFPASRWLGRVEIAHPDVPMKYYRHSVEVLAQSFLSLNDARISMSFIFTD